MRKWKCMIVDDEPVAIRVIKQHLAKINNYKVVQTSTDSMQAFEYLSRSQEPVDLLLLDIEMPELNGIQLFKTLKNPPALILITAHRDYAVEGFELNAIDYLMKPVSFPRLIQALDRFEQSRSANTEAPSKDYIFVTVDRKKKKIDLAEILYIESLKDYIRIYTTQERVITKETTSDFEERLPTDSFLRIHRSFIVNMDRIEMVSHDEITLKKHTLPVGRSYKDEVRQKLGIE